MSFITLSFVFLFLSTIAFASPSPILRPRASEGCGKRHFFNGITQYRGVKSGGHDRSYSFHLPSDYDANKPYPLVIGFHGSSSIGLFLELDTKLSDSKYSGNKIMVYPNGINGSWAGPSYHDGPVEEDLQFVSDLVVELKSNFCVDESRIYATGFSNGGGFIGTLACSKIGGEFAALASSSGAFYTDINGPDNGCTPARSPLPILEIHGGNDKTVLYAGGQGEGGPEPPIREWLEYWVKRNKCTGLRQEDSFGGIVHHLSWTCGGVDGALQHYKIDDMGHAWASTEPNLSQLAALEGPTHIQASEIIMKFFDGFTRPI